jgi:hypothetical protein
MSRSLFVGLHKTPTLRGTGGSVGREIVDVNYRRVEAEFTRQGEYFSTVETFRFFRGRSTRRHQIVEFAIYSAAKAGRLLWFCHLSDHAMALKAGFQFLLTPMDIVIRVDEMEAILHELRPTSFQLISDGFRLTRPPARIVAHDTFEPIKGSEHYIG